MKLLPEKIPKWIVYLIYLFFLVVCIGGVATGGLAYTNYRLNGQYNTSIAAYATESMQWSDPFDWGGMYTAANALAFNLSTNASYYCETFYHHPTCEAKIVHDWITNHEAGNHTNQTTFNLSTQNYNCRKVGSTNICTQ